MNFTVVIPARYHATRLPGKPLVMLGDKPMVQHVYERGLASGAHRVVVATEDNRVAEVAKAFGAEVALTKDSHATGTDRIAEVAEQLGLADDAIIVNLQGDEPFMPSELIAKVAHDLYTQPAASVATVAVPIQDYSEVKQSSIVKVVTDQHGMALYFSRASIPWDRASFDHKDPSLSSGYLRHLGLYAYRCGVLRRFTQWPPTRLEQLESLEQLRVLWHGERIYVAEVACAPAAGVDTPEDVIRVQKLLNH